MFAAADRVITERFSSHRQSNQPMEPRGTVVEVDPITQARYFFPMIPAASVLVMIGLHTIAAGKARVYAQVLVIAGMLAVNIYIFTAYVLPYWYVRADSPLL